MCFKILINCFNPKPGFEYVSYSPTLELNSPMNVNHRMENAPPTLRGARRAVTEWSRIRLPDGVPLSTTVM